MELIDFILNLAGLLLWVGWLSVRFDPVAKSLPATLAGTIRRAEPRGRSGWHFVAALVGLLLFRGLLYWQIGPAIDWTPSLGLGATAIFLRSDFLGRALLFSVLSFALALAVFYLWLLFLSLVNCRAAEATPLQRLVRLHLGRIDAWSWPLKLVLPFLLGTLVWLTLMPLLTGWKIIPPAHSLAHRLEQAGTIGLGMYLRWKFLIGGLLVLYLLGSYVFLGNHPFWNFIAVTGRNALGPLCRLPLRVGKIDLAPVVAIALVFLAAGLAERGLTALYQRLPL